MRYLSSLFILTALWAQESVESRNWLNQGVRAFQNAEYAAAIRAFQRAIDLDPSSLTPHLYLATAYFQQYIPGAESPENTQMAARAKEQFSQVLVFDPTNKVALASMASLYLNEKKWDDAQQWYEKLVAVDPNNADAYYSLGFIAWSKWLPAYQAARASAGLKPDDPGPIPDLVAKQDLRRRLGSVIEEGIANLQKTLELNPRYEDAMTYIGLLIRARADLRDTKEEWRQDVAIADQWNQRVLETKRAGGGAGFSPQAGIATSPLFGQVSPLVGLPAYGVTLSGSLENPVIENHSGRVVIGYDVKFSDANGRGMVENRVMADSMLPAGIPDGGSVYVKGALPINPTVPMPSPPQRGFTVQGFPGQGPIVTAALRSVIFSDGQFVGADEQGSFEQFATKLKAITEVGMMAKNQGWSPIEALAHALAARRQAPPPSVPPEEFILTIRRQTAAVRLVQTRKSKGEGAADQLAQIYSSLPTLWK